MSVAVIDVTGSARHRQPLVEQCLLFAVARQRAVKRSLGPAMYCSRRSTNDTLSAVKVTLPLRR